jgi:flagellar biosynthetic protein FliR
MPPELNAILRPDAWPTFVFVSARLSGLMFIAPLWSMTALPRFARAAVVVVISMLLLPLSPPAALPAQILELPLPLAMEIVIGVAIGLSAAVVVQGAALAGEIVAMQMGIHLGAALSPMPDLELSGVAQLQTMLALFVYVSVGGHLLLLRTLADSLVTLPPGAPLALVEGGRAAVALLGQLFLGAVRTGAPVIVALLVSNVALAILSRAVPQLNTMMVSFPLTIGLGLVMLGASLPVLSGTIESWMRHLPDTAAVALDAFRAAPAGP